MGWSSHMFFGSGSETAELGAVDLKAHLFAALATLEPRGRVLAVPPDFTRRHSRAGELTAFAHEFYRERLTDILPALGTHYCVTPQQMSGMFGNVPHELFRVHGWRRDVETLGEVPGEFIQKQSEGKLDYAWPAQVNRMLLDRRFDLILSLGQVVPHEISGMANYNKNILIGTGGVEAINRSHFLGAVYGMERIMGRAVNPVRNVFNYATESFLRDLPIVYVLTVVGRNEEGRLVVRGLFIGDGPECFERAAALSLRVNFEMLDREIRKAVVYLDPGEFRTTWLGNKAIYRMRMALANDAELIVLAPGVAGFGEDASIDALIRRHGYFGTEATLAAVKADPALEASLSAPAHLIHGSSEGRFGITYCPGGLSKDEVEAVGYRYADLDSMMKTYHPSKLESGFNTVGGEEIFFVPQPALGLWAHRARFERSETALVA